jgi:hypothetical protein
MASSDGEAREGDEGVDEERMRRRREETCLSEPGSVENEEANPGRIVRMLVFWSTAARGTRAVLPEYLLDNKKPKPLPARLVRLEWRS